MKVAFIVSTLRSCGPTTQLYNLINNLDFDIFDVDVITLSPEPAHSSWSEFQSIGVRLHSLNMSRFSGMFRAKTLVRERLLQIQPDIVHTQGFRADRLMAAFQERFPWVMTSRNFPADDYPTKFGGLKGVFMMKRHLSTMRSCRYLVSCSKTIQKKLFDIGIDSAAIQNGVRRQSGDSSSVPLLTELERPIYISVGSLIPRKNMSLLLAAFKRLPHGNRGSLVILGDGPMMSDLRNERAPDIHLIGDVENVADYLAGADYFVSTSLSEGLPNTVLEALESGLPCILSDIESHQEIARESPKACRTFDLEEDEPALIRELVDAKENFDDKSRYEAKRLAREVFSAERMSLRYQEFYSKILGAK